MLVALYFFIITRENGDITGNISHITDSIINIVILGFIIITTNLESNYYDYGKIKISSIKLTPVPALLDNLALAWTGMFDNL